jgi:hypothetical protein
MCQQDSDILRVKGREIPLSFRQIPFVFCFLLFEVEVMVHAGDGSHIKLVASGLLIVSVSISIK